MPDYSAQISDPNLSGLGVSPVNVSKGDYRAAGAAALTQVLSLAASAYGQSKAKKAGQQIGGEGETFESAGQAAEQAKKEVEDLIRGKTEIIGADPSQEQVADLKKQVFDRVLTNQKRLQAALKRGAISSTEATARLNVLRNEALSNPLVAAYQDELDNALYVTTGGAGNTFGKTAEEIRQATVDKAQLEALAETEKQISGLINTRVAASRDQALNIIAQQQQHQANMAFYEEKKARIGVTSDEAYAASQTLTTAQASSAYGRIAQWVSSGADAKQISSIRLSLAEEGEQIKAAIRKSAIGKNGETLVDSNTLRQQIDEVDKNVSQFSRMLDDQSATKQLVDVMAQRTAALDYQNQTINIELAKIAPMFVALKDNQAAGQWLWDNAINVNQMRTQWQESSNPLLKMIGRLSPQEGARVVTGVSDKIVNGSPLDNDDKAISAELLTQKGATAAVDEGYKKNPDQVIKNLSETPFQLKQINSNLEWLAKAKTPEGKEQVSAIVAGSARRAITSSFNDSAGEDDWVVVGRGAKIKEKRTPYRVPEKVLVRPKKNVVNNVETWDIDTGGIWVNDAYKSELVNAYKLGTATPSLWNDRFETIDDWLNSLFTRPAN